MKATINEMIVANNKVKGNKHGGVVNLIFLTYNAARHRHAFNKDKQHI